jgi:DNA topoisomerase-1
MDGCWLIITEKDNTARRIASILFKDVKRERKYGINIYHSPSDNAYVLGLKGHIVELDFPKEYRSWQRVPLQSLLKAELVKEVKEKGIVRLLKELGRKASKVTIATDYDREGELIGFEALEIIREVNPSVKVDRAKYSAITPADIKNAFSNRTSVDINLAKAAETRQIIDLIWGSVLTRMISLSSGRLGKDFLSVGRVQSPTLRLIVEREKEIQSFVPSPYWEIFARFKHQNGEFEAKHVKRFEVKEEAQKAFERIGKTAEVTKFVKSTREEAKPIPFNTTEFLREASKFMSPDRAMSIAENLYMNGYISYPRTDNTVYPKTLNVIGMAKQFLASNSPFKKEAEIVFSQEKIVPSRGRRETQDHPPIYPTAVATQNDLGKDEWKIYELVVRRFLATLAPTAIWDVKTAEIDANGEKFRASGRKLVREGWRAIYIYSKAEESFLPDMAEGDILEILKKNLVEKETKPPGRYSTGNLIKIMERLGLGTKSTRHEIIKKLYSRKYVYGNPLRPTQTAFAVIDALKNNAETITLPDMTAKLEKDMDAIAEGKIQQNYVVEESVKFLQEILKSTNLSELSKNLKEGVRKDNVIGKCPECGRELVVRRTKDRKRFIGCSGFPDCRFTLPLPQNGSLYVTAKKCKEHEINMVKIKTKKGYWDLGCPYCNYLEWKAKQS